MNSKKFFKIYIKSLAMINLHCGHLGFFKNQFDIHWVWKIWVLCQGKITYLLSLSKGSKHIEHQIPLTSISCQFLDNLEIIFLIWLGVKALIPYLWFHIFIKFNKPLHHHQSTNNLAIISMNIIDIQTTMDNFWIFEISSQMLKICYHWNKHN